MFLDTSQADMWDSGWVQSDDMQLIRYNGKPLRSDQTYYWTVAVKDENGNESGHKKRARYIAYSIAPALNRGKNVIALWLGTSWSIFAPYATPDKPRTPIVIAQADLCDRDGKKMVRIETDGSWKTDPSPNKLIGNWGFGVGGYGGEIWDANKEVDGWNLATLDDRNWKNATIYTPT
jgi:alpha-L-rhamnosidase